MKVARKKPATVQSPVYVNPDCYEIWYAEPKSLGRIYKRNGYWYTTDGLRFVSSRDAMKYLVGKYSKGTPVQERRVESVPVEVERRGQILRKQITPQKATPKAQKEPQVQATDYSQLHPRFEEFLDFINFQARRKSGALASSTGKEGTGNE